MADTVEVSQSASDIDKDAVILTLRSCLLNIRASCDKAIRLGKAPPYAEIDSQITAGIAAQENALLDNPWTLLVDLDTAKCQDIIVCKEGAAKSHIAIDFVCERWCYKHIRQKHYGSEEAFKRAVQNYVAAGFTHWRPMFNSPDRATG